MLRSSHAIVVAIVVGLLAGCQKPVSSPPPVPRPPVVSFPLTIQDDLGTTVTFERAPQRIVTLAPSLTEIAFALGLGDRLVGVTNYCKYPPEALHKEKVGGYVDSSEEKVVSLAPEVVFWTRGTPTQFVEGLRGAGLKAFALDQGSFAQVVASMATMGRLCGVSQAGEALAGKLRGARDAIAAKTATLSADQRPRALMIVSLDPLFVAGTATFQNEMLQACGATNAAANLSGFGNLSLEAVVTADPQLIVMTNDENGHKMTREEQLKRLRASAAWRQTAAVKNGRVVVVEAAHVSVPGPRLELGLKAMAQAIHPELFPHP